MTLGHAGRLYVVRVPHRGGQALDPSAAEVVLTGVRQVAAAGSDAGPGELALLLDPAGHAELAGQIDDLVDATAVLVVPLSDDEADFQLEAEHGFGSQLESAGAEIAHVEVRWGPDHDPAAKKTQAVELTRLAAWLHETDRSLLVELVVPGLGARADDERTDELLKTVREVREVGIEADLWAVPGPLGVDAAQAMGELVRDAGRDDVGILVADGDLPAVPRRAAVEPGARVAGFVLGPTIWSDALRRWRTGTADDAAAATMVAERLRQEIAAARGSNSA